MLSDSHSKEMGLWKIALTLDKSFLLDMVKPGDEIEADFIAGEYRNKFYIAILMKNCWSKLFGIDAFKPENQFQANLVTENPNAILLQTRAADKYALAEEMNALPAWTCYQLLGRATQHSRVCSKGSNKAFALQYLLNVLNVDPQKSDCLWWWAKWYWDAVLCWFWLCHEKCQYWPAAYADQQLSLTNDQDGVALSSTNSFYKSRQLAKLCLRFVFSFVFSRPQSCSKALKIEAYPPYHSFKGYFRSHL